MTEPRAIFEDMKKQAEEIGANVVTISGEAPGGWGFRIQVVAPHVWEKIQKRDEKFDPEEGE